jgi:DNA-binding MarR family transcriptional regulator
MFRDDDNLCSVNAQPPRTPPDAPPGTAPGALPRTAPGARSRRSARPVSRDEAFETSRLLVDLLHAAHASRRASDTPEGDPPGTGRHAAPASEHAIRAAIYLYQHGERTVGQLASGLGISRGWASRVADELIERGLAAREGDPGDRRVVRLHLTEDALIEIERAYRWRGDVVEAALAEHGPAERAAIRRFLRQVAVGLAGDATTEA